MTHKNFPVQEVSLETFIYFIFAAGIAFANGANDNFKGVATLFGSKTCSYRTALLWGTAATFLGSLVSFWWAENLLASFSGKGLVPNALVGEVSFLAPVAGGAALTVLLASSAGLPISTTHALLGGLVGSGLVFAPGEVRWTTLSSLFVLPLLSSPFLSALLSILLYRPAHALRLRLGIERESCVCVDQEWVPLTAFAGGAALKTLPASGSVHFSLCRERYNGRLFFLSAEKALTTFHFFSAGLVSFSRGLNDTPKLAALLGTASFFPSSLAPLAVGLAMVFGALFFARRVAETMSFKITEVNDGQGFCANAVTALLVSAASFFGLPVSTTHVSTGALAGIGLSGGRPHYSTWKNVFSAWVFTLPVSAFLAAAAAAMIRLLF